MVRGIGQGAGVGSTRKCARGAQRQPARMPEKLAEKLPLPEEASGAGEIGKGQVLFTKHLKCSS